MMLPLRTLALLVAIGLVAAAARPTGGRADNGGEALAVVVSASAPVHAMSLGDLRRVFLGQPVEQDGVKLIPLNHPINSASRTLFDRAVLQMSPDQVGRYWVAERIRGSRSAPKSVGSTQLLLKVVSKVPGAISYVPRADLRPGLRAVRIDGKHPGEPGYPL